MTSTAYDAPVEAAEAPRHPKRRRAGSMFVFYAITVFWLLIVIVPLLILFVYSFFTTEYFQTIYTFSLDTWRSLFASGRFGVALRTLRIALTVTLIELIVGFPFALWLSKGTKNKTVQAFCLALLTIPFFLDISSRTIVWNAILGQNGLINTALVSSGLVDQPVTWLLYSEFSVQFGMTLILFPTMVLPIYIAMSLIDDSLLEASKDLGATPAQTLWRVIVPLALPGVVAGFLFTLGPALAAWVEPSILGGGFVNLLSNSIESAYTALSYPVVSALSTLVIALLAVLLGVMLLVLRVLGTPSLALN